jgi:hypothetical protein
MFTDTATMSARAVVVGVEASSLRYRFDDMVGASAKP